MKNLIQKYRAELITFGATVLLLTICFALSGLFQSGILVADLHEQYYSLLSHYSKILSGETGFYSFSFGLGDHLGGTFFYYLASPFNLLLLFVPNSEIFIVITVFFRLALAASFACHFFKYHFKSAKSSYLIVFSLLYAMSSCTLSYYSNIIFLDVYMLFPLVLLGIDYYFKENHKILLSVSFFLTIFNNFYLAFMVGVFSLIYFNYRLLQNKINYKIWFKRNFKFIILLVLICFLASCVLIPTICSLGNYPRSGFGLFSGEPLRLSLEPAKITKHYFLGDFSDVDTSNLYSFYLFSSILILPLIYFYFQNPKISRREKKATAIIFLILCISISFNWANYAWHGFSRPVGFNGRFTFIFILFSLLIALKALILFPKDSPLAARLVKLIKMPAFRTYLLLALFISLVPLVLLLSITTPEIYTDFAFVILIAALAVKIYFLILKKFLGRCPILPPTIRIVTKLVCLFTFSFVCLVLAENSFFPTLAKLILLGSCLTLLIFCAKTPRLAQYLTIILIAELTINGYLYLNRFCYETETGNETDFAKIITEIKEYDQSAFYRIDADLYDIVNSSTTQNYSGIDYALSTMPKYTLNFFDKTGLNEAFYTNTVSLDGKNILLSSLLGVKYLVVPKYPQPREIESPKFQKILENEYYTVYENKDALSLGYLVNPKLEDVTLDQENLENINSIYQGMLGDKSKAFTKIKLIKVDSRKEFIESNKENLSSGSETRASYTFTNESTQDFFVYITGKSNELRLFINDEEIYRSSNHDYGNLFQVPNQYQSGETIRLSVKDGSKNPVEDVDVYYYNPEVYEKAILKLKLNQLEVTHVGKDADLIEGVINADTDGVLFTSIPYDKNLHIFIDGEEVPTLKLLDTFLGTKLETGRHKILISYTPDKIYLISAGISVVGAVVLAVYIYISSLFSVNYIMSPQTEQP